jgi:hypothetical protein
LEVGCSAFASVLSVKSVVPPPSYFQAAVPPLPQLLAGMPHPFPDRTATRCVASATGGCRQSWSRTARAFRHHRPSNSRQRNGAT